MRISSYRAAALLAALLILPGAAKAQWLVDGSATTTLTTPSTPNVSATVSYAVFNNTTGAFAAYLNSAAGAGLKTALGSSATALEADKYIYFYQVTNPKAAVKEFSVGNPGATNVAASANGYVFKQNGNALTTGGLASTGPGGSAAGSSPTNLTFATNPNSKGANTFPNGQDTFPDGTPSTAFGTSVGGTSGKTYTSLMVLGSNNDYMPGQVETSGGGGTAVAFDVPVPGPEPSTFALLALGLPILGLRYGRRLQNRLKGVAPQVA